MLEELVAKYITLRDQKARLKAKYESDVASIDEALARCEGYFLKAMNDQGLTSLPTSAGVPYKQIRVSANVADWNATLPFIREHELWHMLEKRVNKTAIEQYAEENGDVPPGVNIRREVVVNVRRAA